MMEENKKYKRGQNPNSRKGSPFIKGHKSFSKKGRFVKGSKGHLGHKHSQDTKTIMRLKKLKETTPLRLQVRNSTKYNEWVIRVFERDNWICQSCYKRGSKLEAHHKKLYSQIFEENNIKTFEEAMKCEELWNLDNGVTQCEKCHKIIHVKILRRID